LRLALAAFEPLLEANVAKEIRKDAQVIGAAAQCLASGSPPGAKDADRLIAGARDVDREFLDRAAGLPLRLDIPYARIEPLRRQRIERGLDLAYRILAAWRSGRRMRDALSVQGLEQGLRGLLALYCEETAALACGVQTRGPIAALRERAAGALRDTMADVAQQLAYDAARSIHRPRIAAQKSA